MGWVNGVGMTPTVYRLPWPVSPCLVQISPPLSPKLLLASSTHTLLGRVTELTMASPKSLYCFLVLYAICLKTPACFVDYELACLSNRGTDYVCSHTRDSDTLLVAWTLGLPSYSNHLLLVDEIAVQYDIVAI